MVILLFGISNVGKTTTGELLSKQMNYKFLDLDVEITKYFKLSIDGFQRAYPDSFERARMKAKVLNGLVEAYKDNIVISVSIIFYANLFNDLLDQENILAIELQDSVEHIFERLVFSDGNDIVYKDDEYKNKNKEYYLEDISEDMAYCIKVFEKIQHKFHINNMPPEEVVDNLFVLIKSLKVDE